MRNGNGRIIQYKDYVAGWLDSSISEFLDSFSELPEDMRFTLITCLDSNDDGSELLAKSPVLRPLNEVARLVGRGIVLPTKKLVQVNAETPLFFGFDEIWFFPHDQMDAKPESAWLVGPHRVNRQKMRKIGPWLARNLGSLGLGDGNGLNIVAKIGGMARHLVGHSLSQPQHAISGEAD